VKNSLHTLHPPHPSRTDLDSAVEGVSTVRGVRRFSQEEKEGLRLLARFLVRAYLKDRATVSDPEDPEGKSPRDADPV
jgi:hypothetical protein